MFTHLLIDFDNTMMATEQYAVPSLIARFNALYADRLPMPLTVETFQAHFHGQSRDILCQNLGAFYGIQVDCALLYAGREGEMAEHLRALPGGVEMAAGLVETLAQLQAIGIRPCLVSNNGVQRALAAMRYAANGRGEELAALLGTRMFEAGDIQKPLPDVYLRALRQCSATAAESLAIEDSITGVAAARGAGLAVYGFTGFADDAALAADKLKAAGCRHVFNAWHELQDLLRSDRLIA
jgi:beta-phosphoglucomutase-like phosphatase (HAD superfamily)